MEMEQRALQLAEQVKQKPTSIVEQAREKTMQEIAASEDFKRATDKLYQKEVETDLTEKAIVIANKELQNEYDRYALEKKKDLLDLQVKYEKGLVKEQVKAKIQQEKIAIAIKRYGYLSPLLDDEGKAVKDEKGNIQVDMSKFTPNKLSNRFKELEFNYNNMSKTARKIIWTTIKTVIFTGMIALAGWLIYEFVIPVLQKIQV